MSSTDDTSEAESFREEIRKTFDPHMKSAQSYDHPDNEKEPLPLGMQETEKIERNYHYDGEDIYQSFRLTPLPKFLRKAARNDHAVAKHPSAFPHFVTHIKEWEKWEMGEPDPDFGDLSRLRKELFEWYLGYDQPEGPEREDAYENRTERLRPGGTGIVLHGEQGTTKTTAMYWLIAQIMQTNPQENVIWQSTLDDTEWQIFAPWATVCVPSGVDIRVTANPHVREYRHIGEMEIGLDDISRQVIEYDDPEDLMATMADRTPGQFYVVYPDPKFRKCQRLTTYSYESMWEVDDSAEATDLGHFWFALMEAIHNGNTYNEWTTLVGDEAHKWLRQGKGNDEHDWWNKIDDWATYWGDARKERLSVILAIHKWREIHDKVTDKIRWGGTMNGEDFPSEAPLEGANDFDQGLGDVCIWNNQKWNHVGYPDIKRNFSVGADISVSYPGLTAEKQRKS